MSGATHGRGPTAHAPLYIIDRDDPDLAEAHKLARQLLEVSLRVNAKQGLKFESRALSTAFQCLILQDRDRFTINDVLNGLAASVAWAIHELSPLARIGVLASMQEQIMVMAEDSSQAATLKRGPVAGKA